ncbi:MAG TPA: DNA repair protein RadC [Bacilli bacterium]|nr:DNA repair protein RadC [Bacilli bacterium]
MSGSKLRIKDLAPLNQPREKARYYGIKTLTDQELIALLIGQGTRELNALHVAQNLLNVYVNLNNLARVKDSNLLYQPGIKDAKALKLIAAFEVARRVNGANLATSNQKYSIARVAQKYQNMIGQDEKEQLILLHLNRHQEIIMEETLYIGHAEGFLLDAREIMRRLLISDAKLCVLVHNHPSNDPRPSKEDLITTRKLRQIATKFDLVLFDHLIVTQTAYFSFKQENLL